MELTVQTTACSCPKCGADINAATSVDGVYAKPAENDLSVCLSCGNMLAFNNDLTLRVLGMEEFLKLDDTIKHTLIKTMLTVGMCNKLHKK